jgi:hypothetical protein
MFTAYCPTHRSNVLLGFQRIRGLANLDGLIVVELECVDGERLLVPTGKRFHDAVP